MQLGTFGEIHADELDANIGGTIVIEISNIKRSESFSFGAGLGR